MAAPTPTASAPATSTPGTADEAGWTTFGEISERNYRDPAMVIDDHGFAHVAAVLDSAGAIFHVTNTSGRWTRERISAPPQDTEDDSPAIAIDHADGSIWVVFSRRSSVSAPNFSEGVYLVINRGGSWGDEEPLPYAGEDPTILVEDGQLHVTFNDTNTVSGQDLNDTTHPVYATNATGSWASVSLADIGRAVAIHRSSRGPIVVLVAAWGGGDVDNAHAFIATQAGGDQMAFDLEQRVPGAEGGGYSFEGGFGHNDLPFVSWHRSNAGNYRFKVQTRDGWTNAGDGRAEAVDSLGGVHYLTIEPLVGEGDGVELWYRTDRNDGFGSRVLFAGSVGVWTSLALDAQDRPHVFYSGAGSYYGIGPGN